MTWMLDYKMKNPAWNIKAGFSILLRQKEFERANAARYTACVTRASCSPVPFADTLTVIS